jgi:hypothetical protein
MAEQLREQYAATLSRLDRALAVASEINAEAMSLRERALDLLGSNQVCCPPLGWPELVAESAHFAPRLTAWRRACAAHGFSL